MSTAPSVTTPNPASIVTSILAGLVIAIGVIFGIRDAWVAGAGINGSWAGGTLLVAITVIPIVLVVICVVASRRQGREASSSLMRAGVVGLCVGIPVTFMLVIGAAY
jgi:hypothetical protein